MKKGILLFIALYAFQFSFAQKADTTAIRFSKAITAEELKKHLSILASDEYEGRETGQKGQKMSAEYLKKNYESWGIPAIQNLDKGYYQSYPLSIFEPQQLKIQFDGKEKKEGIDFFSFSTLYADSLIAVKEIQFLGYGINSKNYYDYEGKVVQGKNILLLDGEPKDANGNYLVNGDKKESHWSKNFRSKQQEASKQGANIVLIVDKDLKNNFARFEHRIRSKRMSTSQTIRPSFPLVIYITEAFADELLKGNKINVNQIAKKISETKKPEFAEISNVKLNLDVKQSITKTSAENVLAFVEGSDLKDEVVVVTAHYDHLGIHNGKVYNGADDDGSGTVAVMNIAKAFAEAKKQGKGPRRSVLFMNVSGEEKGLLGSEYYTENPVFPLAKTVCNLNIDMIGRLDEFHASDDDYVYLIGSDMLSTDLHNVSEWANNTYVKTKLDYRYNKTDDPNRYYFRSDHYNFASHKVPVIFYFNGEHEDYHQETDEVSKINFKKMERITRLVFFTAWEIANRNERLKVDKEGPTE